MIEVSGLNKSFGELAAVKNLSFSVNKGEVLGFLGPNGAGKSTTMKLITGFINASGGTIKVMGNDIAANPMAVKKEIGYLPEGAPAYFDMTTATYLKFMADIRKLPASAKQSQIDHAIKELELHSVLNQRIETLSKGFKRRVGLAQAILHDPNVLILDEPTDGLDPNQKHQVRKLIKRVSQDKIVIISTHILEEVNSVCNRAIIIANGELLFDGTPAELRSKSRYHNAVVMELVTEQKICADLEKLPKIKCVHLNQKQHVYTIFAKDGTNILEDVENFLRQNNLKATSMYVDRGRLEDTFYNITTD